MNYIRAELAKFYAGTHRLDTLVKQFCNIVFWSYSGCTGLWTQEKEHGFPCRMYTGIKKLTFFAGWQPGKSGQHKESHIIYLFHGYGLCEVARLVYVQAFGDADVVAEQLQRYYCEAADEVLVCSRHVDREVD